MGYYNKPLETIPFGKSRKTGNNERTRCMNWVLPTLPPTKPSDIGYVVRYHNTDIVGIRPSLKQVTVTTAGWDTISTVDHINGVLRRLREYDWMPVAGVRRSPQGMLLVFNMSDYPDQDTSHIRTVGNWGMVIR